MTSAAVPNRQRLECVLLVGVFFVALLPTLPSLARYHGDERYYTDAAITMVQSGDYLTPRYADGTERFRKPLLTYWVLCASYKIFGINVFASRLPFLLAGCGVVWLTWRLGGTLFGKGLPPLFGAVVFAGNVQTMTIATRSTPDILLCLFVTASLCGFADVLIGDSRNQRSYAMAYLGAGLACATKGLWGVLPLLFAAGYWLPRRRAVPFSRFAPAGWVLAGAAIGLSWFIIAALRHGRGSIEVFLEDQTMAQAEPVRWFLLSNVTDYAWATLRHFLPWSLLGLAVAPRFRAFAQANRNALWFALGWYALVFAVFSLGFVRRTRYLLPTYPCIAVILGSFLASVADHRWLRQFNMLILQAAIATGIAAVIIGWRLDWRLAVGGVLLAGMAGALRIHVRLVDLGFFLIAAFSLVMLLWRPVFERNAADELAHRLSVPPFAGRPVAALGLPPVLSSQLRLVSGGRLNPKEVTSESWMSAVPTNAVLIVAEGWREKAAAAGYKLAPAGYRTKRARAGDIWRAWRSGRREDMFKGSRQDYYIGVRPHE